MKQDAGLKGAEATAVVDKTANQNAAIMSLMPPCISAKLRAALKSSPVFAITVTIAADLIDWLHGRLTQFVR